MRRVLFVGAGASAAFGMPLTARILPRAVTRLANSGLFFGRRGRGPDEIDDEKLLTESLHVLYPGIIIRGSEDELAATLPDITGVLSFLDLLIAGDQPLKPRWPKERTARMRVVFDRAICEVLSVPSQIGEPTANSYDSDGARLNTSSFGAGQQEMWARLKIYLQAATGGVGDRLTVITTNYDLLMEAAAAEVFGEISDGSPPFDIGFEFRNVKSGKLISRPPHRIPEPRVSSRFALFKLHGSLNYLRCEVCDQVYVNPNGNIAYQAFERTPNWENTCHCGNGPLRHVIVAPSTRRTYQVPQMLATWAAATEALRTSEEWVFVGYSLPSEDLAIRSLLFRGLHARGVVRDEARPIEEWQFRTAPKITVVQRSDKARPIYELLFGREIRYIETGLEGWLSKV